MGVCTGDIIAEVLSFKGCRVGGGVDLPYTPKYAACTPKTKNHLHPKIRSLHSKNQKPLVP
jgi:hypothetical protein